MAHQSINPATGETLATFDTWDASSLQRALTSVNDANRSWALTPISERCGLMRRAAHQLREDKEKLATIITREMGKLIGEAEAEVEKCALGCEYYAERGAGFLQDEIIETDAGKSYVCYQPIGTVLAVMPWNFPFWQVFRFAAPALVAGNTAVLKHASNVPQCALAIEDIFKKAGFPENVFRTLMISASQAQSVIENPIIKAVTLTGSELAGRQVAAHAGANLKKSVLELGGSDPFVVLDDADLEHTVQNAVTSRFLNAGQSCIAAKRFIAVKSIADKFLQQFRIAVDALKPGDPMDRATTLAPLARLDLRDELHRQVTDSIAAGARVIIGCAPVAGWGAFYQATILADIKPGMRAYEEELFGPVALVIIAEDEADALRIANDTRFGLGGSVWTRDRQRGETFARQMQAGSVFVNGFVKSDPRLPFGGIKASGYGRELSRHGILEFVNIKTVWIR
ncbi:MAG: NAD-dependent succinate-semialdehyde dehydrogenase [Gammaproteobacteria bacterium]|nr:NAD-dependent succinate-semialdehyde dehydrogenase [Gammaproteobacteria bacterium]